MKKHLLHIGVVFLTVLSSLPAMAQIGGDGYYRARNASTNNYISIANNKFSYTTIISSAGGGLKEFLWLTSSSVDNAKRRALACAGIYLQTDIHVVQGVSELIPLESIFYADKKNTNSSNYEYDLVGQGISLLALTTGVYPGTARIHFSKRYLTISPSSGSGANTQYTASIKLQADDYSTLSDMGTRYFVDNDGTFAINESSSATNAKWYVEPITYFNIEPELEFHGKYYTTIKVPFAITLNGQVEKAYTITAANNKSLEYDVIATTGQTVPAGTPVILECGSANAADCWLNPVGAPLTAAADTANTSAPAPNESSNYTGTNLLKGTYFCNTDGSLTYERKSGTGTISCNNYKAITSPQKYVLGINAQGNFGFVKATADNTPNSKMPANKAWLELEGYFAVATPTFDPTAGTKNNPVSVTINCATQGAVIHYTTDGSTPTADSPVYSEPILVEKTTTIKAIAIKGDGSNEGLFNNTSAVASAKYTLKVATPTFSPAAGTYASPQSVTINCATTGASIYYTTDGTNPTNKKTPYTGPITVDHDMTIKAIAYKSPMTASAVGTAVYKFPKLTAEPTAITINEAGGNFTVTGRNLINDVTVTPPSDFSTSYSSEKNTIESWGFVSNNDSVDGTVNVTYQGRELSAQGDIALTTDGKQISVNVTYKPEIYLIGNIGNSGWNYSNGTLMTETETAGIYTTTIEIPANADSWIMFARKTGETYDWNDQGNGANRYFFGASTNGGDWEYNGNYDGGNLETTPAHNNKYCPIKFPQNQAGTYIITVNVNTNPKTFTITKMISAPLSQIIESGVPGKPYIVNNELIGAWASGNMLWAKDQGQQSIDKKAAKQDGQIDYNRDHKMSIGMTNGGWWRLQNNDWDESNWIALDFSNLNENINNYVGKKLTGVKGVYALSSTEYDHSMTLSVAPTASEDRVDGYPVPEQGVPDAMNYGWAFNTYTGANFMETNWNHTDNGNTVGFVTHNIHDTNNPNSTVDLYFMNPKTQEVARIWGVWNSETQAFTVYANEGYNDYSPIINGAVGINLKYNSKSSVSLTHGEAYIFHAIVVKKPQANSSKAPMRYPAPEASGATPTGDYVIYPLDLDDTDSHMTAVAELVMNRDVMSVTYYNVMGQQSSKPFDGINIVVTRYTDGTISATKVLR